MKTSLLSIASAFVLLVGASGLAKAAPVAAPALASYHDDKRRNDHEDRHDYDRRLSPAEKARLEALRRKNDHRADDRYRRNDDRRDSNYDYDKNHRVTSAEKARWEAQHRYDRDRH